MRQHRQRLFGSLLWSAVLCCLVLLLLVFKGKPTILVEAAIPSPPMFAFAACKDNQNFVIDSFSVLQFLSKPVINCTLYADNLDFGVIHFSLLNESSLYITNCRFSALTIMSGFDNKQFVITGNTWVREPFVAKPNLKFIYMRIGSVKRLNVSGNVVRTDDQTLGMDNRLSMQEYQAFLTLQLIWNHNTDYGTITVENNIVQWSDAYQAMTSYFIRIYQFMAGINPLAQSMAPRLTTHSVSIAGNTVIRNFSSSMFAAHFLHVHIDRFRTVDVNGFRIVDNTFNVHNISTAVSTDSGGAILPWGSGSADAGAATTTPGYTVISFIDFNNTNTVVFRDVLVNNSRVNWFCSYSEPVLLRAQFTFFVTNDITQANDGNGVAEDTIWRFYMNRFSAGGGFGAVPAAAQIAGITHLLQVNFLLLHDAERNDAKQIYTLPNVRTLKIAGNTVNSLRDIYSPAEFEYLGIVGVETSFRWSNFLVGTASTLTEVASNDNIFVTTSAKNVTIPHGVLISHCFRLERAATVTEIRLTKCHVLQMTTFASFVFGFILDVGRRLDQSAQYMLFADNSFYLSGGISINADGPEASNMSNSLSAITITPDNANIPFYQHITIRNNVFSLTASPKRTTLLATAFVFRGYFLETFGSAANWRQIGIFMTDNDVQFTHFGYGWAAATVASIYETKSDAAFGMYIPSLTVTGNTMAIRLKSNTTVPYTRGEADVLVLAAIQKATPFRARFINTSSNSVVLEARRMSRFCWFNASMGKHGIEATSLLPTKRTGGGVSTNDIDDKNPQGIQIRGNTVEATAITSMMGEATVLFVSVMTFNTSIVSVDSNTIKFGTQQHPSSFAPSLTMAASFYATVFFSFSEHTTFDVATAITVKNNNVDVFNGVDVVASPSYVMGLLWMSGSVPSGSTSSNTVPLLNNLLVRDNVVNLDATSVRMAASTTLPANQLVGLLCAVVIEQGVFVAGSEAHFVQNHVTATLLGGSPIFSFFRTGDHLVDKLSLRMDQNSVDVKISRCIIPDAQYLFVSLFALAGKKDEALNTITVTDNSMSVRVVSVANPTYFNPPAPTQRGQVWFYPVHLGGESATTQIVVITVTGNTFLFLGSESPGLDPDAFDAVVVKGISFFDLDKRPSIQTVTIERNVLTVEAVAQPPMTASSKNSKVEFHVVLGYCQRKCNTDVFSGKGNSLHVFGIGGSSSPPRVSTTATAAPAAPVTTVAPASSKPTKLNGKTRTLTLTETFTGLGEAAVTQWPLNGASIGSHTPDSLVQVSSCALFTIDRDSACKQSAAMTNNTMTLSAVRLSEAVVFSPFKFETTSAVVSTTFDILSNLVRATELVPLPQVATNVTMFQITSEVQCRSFTVEDNALELQFKSSSSSSSKQSSTSISGGLNGWIGFSYVDIHALVSFQRNAIFVVDTVGAVGPDPHPSVPYVTPSFSAVLGIFTAVNSFTKSQHPCRWTVSGNSVYAMCANCTTPMSLIAYFLNGPVDATTMITFASNTVDLVRSSGSNNNTKGGPCSACVAHFSTGLNNSETKAIDALSNVVRASGCGASTSTTAATSLRGVDNKPYDFTVAVVKFQNTLGILRSHGEFTVSKNVIDVDVVPGGKQQQQHHRIVALAVYDYTAETADAWAINVDSNNLTVKSAAAIPTRNSFPSPFRVAALALPMPFVTDIRYFNVFQNDLRVVVAGDAKRDLAPSSSAMHLVAFYETVTHCTFNMMPGTRAAFTVSSNKMSVIETNLTKSSSSSSNNSVSFPISVFRLPDTVKQTTTPSGTVGCDLFTSHRSKVVVEYTTSSSRATTFDNNKNFSVFIPDISTAVMATTKLGLNSDKTSWMFTCNEFPKAATQQTADTLIARANPLEVVVRHRCSRTASTSHTFYVPKLPGTTDTPEMSFTHTISDNTNTIEPTPSLSHLATDSFVDFTATRVITPSKTSAHTKSAALTDTRQLTQSVQLEHKKTPVKEAVAVTGGIAAGIAALASVSAPAPTMLFNQARQQSVEGLIAGVVLGNCAIPVPDPTEEPSPAESLTQMKVGDSAFRYVIGTITGNIILSVSLFFGLLFITWFLTIAYLPDTPEMTDWLTLLERVQSGIIFEFATAMLAPPTLQAGVALAVLTEFDVPAPWHWLGPLLAVFVIIFIVFVLKWTLLSNVVTHSQFVPIAFDNDKLRKINKDSCKLYCDRYCDPDGLWHPHFKTGSEFSFKKVKPRAVRRALKNRKRGIEQLRHDQRTFHISEPLFDTYRAVFQRFFLLELLVQLGLLITTIIAHYLPTSVNCLFLGAATTLIFFSLLVYHVARRPLAILAQHYVIVFATAVDFGCALLATLFVHAENREWLQDMEAVLAVVNLSLAVVLLAVWMRGNSAQGRRLKAFWHFMRRGEWPEGYEDEVGDDALDKSLIGVVDNNKNKKQTGGADDDVDSDDTTVAADSDLIELEEPLLDGDLKLKKKGSSKQQQKLLKTNSHNSGSSGGIGGGIGDGDGDLEALLVDTARQQQEQHEQRQYASPPPACVTMTTAAVSTPIVARRLIDPDLDDDDDDAVVSPPDSPRPNKNKEPNSNMNNNKGPRSFEELDSAIRNAYKELLDEEENSAQAEAKMKRYQALQSELEEFMGL